MKDLGKKKLLIITGGLIGIVILIIIILLVYNALFVKTGYKDIETKLVNAAKNYYADNSSILPKNDNEEVSISDSSLTSAGYLKSMNELTKDIKGNTTCTATVIVSYANGEYRYTPLLDCGKEYSTKTLSSYIKANEAKVFDGQGLYELNGQLVYRGENPNNYIKFAGKNWRIVKIDNEQTVLILNEKNEKNVWDDRFNTERDREDGINDYKVSRIYDNLTNMYNESKLISDSSKNLLVARSLEIGKRYSTDVYNDGSIERGELLENQYIGLLPVYDYINASIDSNCNTAENASCANYNYLVNFDYSWWTMTADASNTYRVYRVTMDGALELTRAISNAQIRPVVSLAKDVIYVKGIGTEENPYIIK